MRIRGIAWIALAGSVAAAYWSCGGGNDHGANFSGQVSNVVASLPARDTRAHGLALHFPGFVARADAQTACTAPGSGALLIFCIQTNSFETCQPVDPASCTFTLNAVIENGPTPIVMRFVDDTNANVQRDSGEPTSTVSQNLFYCDDDQIEISNAVVDFRTGVTTASVSKTVDRCTNVTATPTVGTPLPTRTGTPSTPTPTRTGTPSTPTPTRTGTPMYGAGAPLQRSPSSMLAFLFGAGAVGLLIPRRNDRRR